MGKVRYLIPMGAKEEICRSRGCGATIFWITSDKGKRVPVDPDGTLHFKTCPTAKRIKKYDPARDPKRPGQSQRYHILSRFLFRMANREREMMLDISMRFKKRQQLSDDEDHFLKYTMDKYDQ